MVLVDGRSLRNSRPEEVFFYDQEHLHPVADLSNPREIRYNLSAMPDCVKAWVDLITHEWLAKFIPGLGYYEEEWVVEEILEWAGLAWPGWGGCIGFTYVICPGCKAYNDTDELELRGGFCRLCGKMLYEEAWYDRQKAEGEASRKSW